MSICCRKFSPVECIWVIYLHSYIYKAHVPLIYALLHTSFVLGTAALNLGRCKHPRIAALLHKSIRRARWIRPGAHRAQHPALTLASWSTRPLTHPSCSCELNQIPLPSSGTILGEFSCATPIERKGSCARDNPLGSSPACVSLTCRELSCAPCGWCIRRTRDGALSEQRADPLLPEMAAAGLAILLEASGDRRAPRCPAVSFSRRRIEHAQHTRSTRPPCAAQRQPAPCQPLPSLCPQMPSAALPSVPSLPHE